MLSLRRTGWFLVVWLSLAAFGRPSLPAAPEDLGKTAREILAGTTYQKKLVEPEKRVSVAVNGSGSIWLTLSLLASGLAFALVLVWLVSRAMDRQPKEPRPDAAGAGSPDGSPREGATLTEVERHAAAGRFGEAVHLLLLLAVDRLCAGREERPADAFTSRELARILPRTPEERTLFHRLVSTVELFLFGNRSVDEERYRSCLEAFQRLAP